MLRYLFFILQFLAEIFQIRQELPFYFSHFFIFTVAIQHKMFMLDAVLYGDKNITKPTKGEQLFYFPSHDLVSMEINL